MVELYRLSMVERTVYLKYASYYSGVRELKLHSTISMQCATDLPQLKQSIIVMANSRCVHTNSSTYAACATYATYCVQKLTSQLLLYMNCEPASRWPLGPYRIIRIGQCDANSFSEVTPYTVDERNVVSY